ncbi:MAG: hypothetical protein GY822_19665 [Deltaproteobacteria bacterium]|nr:hypothetical protein [Deltaproteobacteria bacterium]
MRVASAIATPGPHVIGSTQANVDGVEIWPPTGDKCDAYIRCCEERSKQDEGLMCLFAIAKNKDCNKPKSR